MPRDRIYEELIRPLLFCLDAEAAHNLVHRLIVLSGPWTGLSRLVYPGQDLATTIAGVPVANPVGLAAGFDKNGHLAHLIGHLGFGFAEIGSVTARSTGGNPKPRLFRLPDDEAVINRLGLNGEGADAVAKRLAQVQSAVPLGLNIAKTNDPAVVGDAAIEDFLYTFKAICRLPISFVTVNASCPNTHEGAMKEGAELGTILSEMQKLNERKLPLLVKLSPDSTDEFLDQVAEIGKTNRLSGYVCGNTTLSRADLTTAGTVVTACGNGGLSGRPLKPRALHLCKRMHERKQPDQSITACGGIQSGSDAYEFFLSGATSVQVYTGLVYRGPTLVRQINEELSALLARDGRTLAHLIETKVS